ncbi:MAG: LssY C-terminal domain-containing protein, partial [Acidobacteria bacterium]|nr:LssY C-terminal domain-containing protein [Acidobacteriota bacterium]
MHKSGIPLLTFLAALGLCLASDPGSDSRLELRLQQEVNSYSSAVGDPVQAVLIAPYTVSGLPRIAPGARVMGEITEVRRVGVGFVRETATLGFRFSKVELPDGTWVNIRAQVLAIDNAREKVDKNGRIRGIRSTNTPGFRAAGLLTTLAAVDPIALAFSTAAFAAVLRFSEPEIRLKAGTEFIVKLADGPAWEPLPPQLLGLAEPMPPAFLERIPYRTQTPGRRQESDLTNLLLAGSPEAIERAFFAAGWQVPEALSSATAYRTFRALAGNQEYSDAPMSTLLLDGQSPVQSWSKALNTFSKRHHLRLYATKERWQDKPVFTAAATQDVAINFSRGKGLFTHVIDENIDRERNKVVHDLLFTGCVEAAQQFPRPWVPAEAFNATGQELVTDRAIAVLVFSDCFQPRRFDEIAAPAPGPYRGNPVARVARQTVLTVRNDLFRGSLIYQGASILTMATKNYRRSRNSLQPMKGPTLAGPVAHSPKLQRGPEDWAPASVELALNAG